MKTINVNTFEELYKELKKNCGHSLYRGLPDSTYALKPKVGRVSHPPITDQEKDKFYKREEALFERFCSKGYEFLPSNSLRNEKWHRLTLAQHYGLPTRLMDWTNNPLVAAYFSIGSEDHDQTEGAIHKIGYRHYCNELPECPFWDAKPCTICGKTHDPEWDIFAPPHITKRLANQSSVFTIHFHPWKEVKTLANHKKYVITTPLKEELTNMLPKLGIRSDILFPDLSGIVNEIILWDDKEFCTGCSG